jgi:hypothetical protein
MRKMEAFRSLRAAGAVFAVLLCAGAAAAAPATPRHAASRICQLMICQTDLQCHCSLNTHCQLAQGSSSGICVEQLNRTHR